MKKLTIYLCLACMVMGFNGCGKDEPEPIKLQMESLTAENYPRVDGSTSTGPLNTMIACKLLGIDYKWVQQLHYDGTYLIQPDYEQSPADFFGNRVKVSQTHYSFINLIDNNVDLILSARKMSDNEKEYAQSKGVNLTETPIALDAFVFIVNSNNPVKNLTIKQIQDIYTGNMTNWKNIGGSDLEIKPYIRENDSGSQEIMESLVMEGLVMPKWPEYIIYGMLPVFHYLSEEINALCYTVFYYKEIIVREERIKSLSVDGVAPNKENIKNKSYPYTTEVYAIIRSDEDPSSMAYKLYELLQSEEGKAAIAESGYIPN